MLPSLNLSSSSSSSAASRVDKATSDLLVAPDWTLNIDICDFCNSNHWLAKDAVKEVKRRLQHKNPKVQLLTLTLLETMVKNCGEYIHYHIAERKLLDEMIKLVKKKADMHVREKILVLLDSWQEAFGGPGGKYAQYYWACDELRRCGVHFPQRSPRSAPVITPPLSHPSRVAQVGFGVPANSSRRLDEAMSSEVESLSNSTLESMQNALELLDDMLQAVNPNDRISVKDEVIVELADRCRTNQKKLMQMITTTTDEELLAQGLEMNDSLQSVLARHDGIASGAPLPSHKKNVIVQPSKSPDYNAKATEARDETLVENGKSPASNPPALKAPTEEDEEEDEFSLLARRHSKAQSAPSQNGAGSTEDAATSSGSNNALVLVDAPTPPRTTTNDAKEQDLIDLLSIVLTTSSTSSEIPPAPSSAPNSAPAHNAFETSFNNYVVPWAQPQQMPQSQSMPQLQTQYQQMQSQMPTQAPQGYTQYSPAYPPPPWEATPSYGHNQIPAYNNLYLYQASQVPMNNSPVSMQGSWSSQNVRLQYGNQPVYSSPQAASNSSPLQGGPHPLQHSNSFYNPPSTNGNLQHSNSFHNPPSTNGNLHTASQSMNGLSSSPMQGGARSLQQVSSFPARVGNDTAMNGSTTVLNNGSSGVPPSGQKPFIPSYRLFEDLNVLGSSEGKLKSGPYPSASGTRI